MRSILVMKVCCILPPTSFDIVIVLTAYTGGTSISIWIYRTGVIQGLQQLYSLGLWYWGSIMQSSINAENNATGLMASPALFSVCVLVALLLWIIGIVLFLGLPDYYHETPGTLPALWRSILRRKTIAWYFFAVVLQNYFLSALYGRNWSFLFSSTAAPSWAIGLLALVFLGLVWSGVLVILSRASRNHPWLFPVFVVGLGAPRWAQILWGTSTSGLWLPWAGSAISSALVSRSLWLWLGVLDGIQSAGIGMILLLTLSRNHVLSVVAVGQAIGTMSTIVGRATAPTKLGPGEVFPNFTDGAIEATSKPWFWIVLLSQILVCVGFFKFFRTEQINKP